MPQMTSKECAEKIIRQEGSCHGIHCNDDSCPLLGGQCNGWQDQLEKAKEFLASLDSSTKEVGIKMEHDKTMDEPAGPSLEGPYIHRGFTKRESAAIALRVPDSGLPWLDSMIQRANRDELAKAAMPPFDPCVPMDGQAAISYQTADAMIKEGEK